MRPAMYKLLVAALPLAAAHNGQHVARQAPGSSSSITGTLPSASGTSVGSTSALGTATGTTAPSAPSISTTYTYSLASTEATAVPLSSITASASTVTSAIPTLPTTYPAGAQPTFDGAPPLPQLNIDVGSYPPLDRTPPTDSPEVQEWIQEVTDSGIEIPNIPPTVAGGCPANLEAARNETICWWTCSGCTSDTDITECPDQGTWGLTFDDGPAPYSPWLFDYLEQKELKATFFVVGSRALSYPDMLRYEHMNGHQIAAHTWAHPALTTLTNEQIIAEFGWTRKIIRETLGVTPNVFRPPYGDIDNRVRAIARAMGMYAVMWTRISPTQTFDTHDFDIQNGAYTVDGVLQAWEYILGNASMRDSGFIALEHDLYQQSVEVATGYILPVVECLNQPLQNSYIETNNNDTNPPAVSGGSVVTLSSGAPGSAQTGSSAENGGDSDGGLAVAVNTLLTSGFAALGAAAVMLV